MNPKRNLIHWVVAAAVAAAVPAYAQHSAHAAPAAPNSIKVAEAGAAQRDLWVGHVFWVRNVVVANLAGNAAAQAAAEKSVVANAKQIAASIEPFYGKEASDKLFNLLAGHYGAVKQYLEAGADETKQAAALK